MDSNNSLPSCDFDIAWDSSTHTFETQIIDFIKAAGVKYENIETEVLQAEGPAGWPLVQFTGPQDDLDRLIKFYNAA